MTQAKTQKNSRKKSTTKTRFYLVDTVQRTRRRVTDILEDYNDTYISRPIDSGKAWVADLKKAPRRTLSGLLDDGRKVITDLNRETRSTVDGMIKDGKAFLTKAGKAPRQTLTGVLDDGKSLIEDLRDDARRRMADLKANTRSLIEGLENDARLVTDEVVDSSRKALDKVPVKRKIEKKVRARIRRLPAQFNLPSREDIDGLARRVGALNEKVDALQRAVAA
jgi:polyhydroxyalkanoate synthesis regulator phasin